MIEQPGKRFFPDEQFQANITEHNGQVRIEFNLPTQWFELEPTDALRFARLIIRQANSAMRLQKGQAKDDI